METEPLDRPSSDAELAGLVKGGESPASIAEAELCRRLRPRVRVFLGRRLADIHAVDDVTQEVLLATLVALREGALKDPRRVGAFTLGVCRNKVREQRRREAASRSALERIPAPEPTPAYRSPVRLGRLEECLSMLGERERLVLRAVFCEGRTSRETGADLGLSAVHVRVLQHRAIAQLRGCVSRARFEVQR